RRAFQQHDRTSSFGNGPDGPEAVRTGWVAGECRELPIVGCEGHRARCPRAEGAGNGLGVTEGTKAVTVDDRRHRCFGDESTDFVVDVAVTAEARADGEHTEAVEVGEDRVRPITGWQIGSDHFDRRAGA